MACVIKLRFHAGARLAARARSLVAKLYCKDDDIIQAMLHVEQRIDAGHFAMHQPVRAEPCVVACPVSQWDQQVLDQLHLLKQSLQHLCGQAPELLCILISCILLQHDDFCWSCVGRFDPTIQPA